MPPDAWSDGLPQPSQHLRDRRNTDSNTFFLRLNGSVPSAAAFHGFPGAGLSIARARKAEALRRRESAVPRAADALDV